MIRGNEKIGDVDQERERLENIGGSIQFMFKYI